MKILRPLILVFLSFLLLIFPINNALAFCGFYVAKADAKLYNQASQVIIAKDGNRTVLTMANDYQGAVKDFAMVVPVPVILKEEQVHIGEPQILERLDEFSAPRLVEYFDADPCNRPYLEDGAFRMPAAPSASSEMKTGRRNALGVTVEEEFTVGEYDIVILSAKESNGLEIWLRNNGYKIPNGASQLLRPYIQQTLKFFVAKVNLTEYKNTGFKSLRPLMMAYESPKFMLPIRLGMLNANGEQDLIVYLLSPKGQVELTNYRTVQVPSDVDIPEFVQGEFAPFYQAMFKTAYEKNGKKIAFVEYAWNMASCDPCSAQPLNPDELRKAGVFWLDSNFSNQVFITRLHVRYARPTFPEDLQFQETANNQFFQGRYVIRHPFKEKRDCDAAQPYYKSVRERQETEAKNLAQLTGWNLTEIRKKINFMEGENVPWWRKLWGFLKDN
ncbi:DUF2330 domain-containing protein [Crocosphaera sp. UHCC 0190]|uniref:DUF2330 domain-containing protein n=1 Tax=Crocosphaera sp. UHCC 0190 TaxID=3110246 RepID=UPI002B1F55E9|nr:DUF2330 domain-containing protein [Crocosphaera sp. UHCC 0190]MEA5508852.1 DUF2330 domain-containing protein [Crocosphaera sp. UHCC 0190]